MRRLVLLMGVIAAMSPSIAAARTTVKSQPGSDRLVPQANLTAANPAGAVGFQEAAISGNTIAAISYLPNSAPPYEGLGVDVFTQPARGWSSEGPAALLAGPDDDEWETVAISGNHIFVGDPQRSANGPGAIYVFTEPPGGWKGTVQPSATLVAPDAGAHALLGSSLSADGNTVVAPAAGAEYVFTKPVGGWTGTIEPSATLAPANGAQLTDTAISGRTVIAGAPALFPFPGAVYVFDEPSTGWAGALHEAAILTPSDGAVLTGGIAFAGTSVAATGQGYASGRPFVGPAGPFTLYLFGEPSGFWSGSVHQQAELTVPTTDPYALGPGVAGSGQAVSAVIVHPGALHECPCTASISAFDEPPGRWTGVNSLAASASAGTVFRLAMDGRTLVAGDETGLHVFRVEGPPRLRRASVSGLSKAKPRLSFTVAAGLDAPKIKSVRVSLPPGLRLAGRRSITVTMKRPKATLVGRLSGRRFTERAALERRIAQVLKFNRHHRKKRTLNLKLTITVLDASRKNTKLPVTITIA